MTFSKKVSIAAAVVLPLALNAFELNFSKSFTKELMPDTLVTNITIRIDSKDEQSISNRLNLFNEEIKRHKAVEKKLGSYNIRPNFKYSSTNAPKIVGYTGELKYRVNSDAPKLVEEFIVDLNEMKKSRDTSILVSGLTWRVKDDTYNVALDILRLDAINWANTYSKNLSKDLNLKCEVKKVNIGSYNSPMYRQPLAARAFSSSAKMEEAVPVPEANHQKVTINPNYVMECK